MPQAAVHVILNPTSGGGRAGRQRERIVRELAARGVAVTIHPTRAAGHAAQLARELADGGAQIIVAAGGDGTVHEVANGILTSGNGAALGLLPTGTGNDFAKVVPGTQRLAAAYDTLAGGRIAVFDVGHVTWHDGSEFFVNAMGSGIDVEVVRQLHRLPNLPGPVKYLIGVIRALTVYQPISLAAETDGERLERKVMIMAVGNGICQGGGFYVTPQASPYDGRLDLCVVDALPMRQVPSLLARVLQGTHGGHHAVTMRSAERIRFEAHGSESLYFQIDGELREPPATRWLEVEVRKAALKVVVANG